MFLIKVLVLLFALAVIGYAFTFPEGWGGFMVLAVLVGGSVFADWRLDEKAK